MSNPHIIECDDGSTMIEWMLDDARFYISIEPDVAESSWGFVSKRGGWTMVSDTLSPDFFATLAKAKGTPPPQDET